MFESNTQNFKSKMAGFSLPGVLVGVALIGISATIISQTVINSRRTQKAAELKLSSNKFQQAALDAVTERVKEFVLENCSGARWGGAGSEVEKAFSEFQLTTDAGEMTKLKFTKSPDLLSGNDEIKKRCREPVGPGTLGSGQFMRFCMEITPTGSPQIDYRLLELLIVPINLASDQAINCSGARGAAAGVKVTWQMFNQIDMAKVSGAGSSKTVLKESGVLLVSAEEESYSGTCGITASRVGTTNQCTVSVKGLGRRPPTLFKLLGGNSVAVNGITWARGASADYDEFTATTTCETNRVVNFRAQSAAGSDFCEADPVPAVPTPTCSAFTVKWSDTTHGKCDYSVTGTGNKVVISDGVSNFESANFSGSMPCSPWKGANGNLDLSASVSFDNGVAISCPAYLLNCNPKVDQIASGPNGSLSVTVDGAGLKHGLNQYRHWLFIFGLGHGVRSRSSSVTIGAIASFRAANTSFQGSGGFAGVGLAVGSSGNYTGANSRYFEMDFAEVSNRSRPASGKGPEAAALSGTIPVNWTGGPNPGPNYDYWTGCMLDPARRGTCQDDLGIYVARCTNNAGNTLPDWFVNGYNTQSKTPETFFNFLRP